MIGGAVAAHKAVVGAVAALVALTGIWNPFAPAPTTMIDQYFEGLLINWNEHVIQQVELDIMTIAYRIIKDRGLYKPEDVNTMIIEDIEEGLGGYIVDFYRRHYFDEQAQRLRQKDPRRFDEALDRFVAEIEKRMDMEHLRREVKKINKD